jgi:hypothetical protein
MNHCCEQFARALEKGTDNEEYGAILAYDGTHYFVGCGFTIYYCPFCGAKL